MTGTIRSLMVMKNFGFIAAGGQDYFFHRSSFEGHWNDLVEDYNKKIPIKVEFEEGNSEKGLRAENVKRLDWPNQ